MQVLNKQASIAEYFGSFLDVLNQNLSGDGLRGIRKVLQMTFSITEICLDCGKRTDRVEVASQITLTNETEAFKFAATVKLQVLYIFDQS